VLAKLADNKKTHIQSSDRKRVLGFFGENVTSKLQIDEDQRPLLKEGFATTNGRRK
jgi:hypothetical protein